MGFNLPNQHDDHSYSCIRGQQQQQSMRQINAMDSKSHGAKAPVTSAYPSPADEPLNTFSPPCSPLFGQAQYHMSIHSESKPTLPPLRSVVQIPSPSSSPQMAPTSQISMHAASDFLINTSAYGRSTLGTEIRQPTIDRAGDALLFPESMITSNENARPQTLFPNLTLPVPVPSTPAQASGQTPPRRRRKAIAVRALSLEPDAEMYGDKGGIINLCKNNPDHYIPLIYGNGWHMPNPRNTNENPQLPSPSDFPRRQSQDGASSSSQRKDSKRKHDIQYDSALDMPPPKRQTRECHGPRPSASPGNAPPLDAPVKKRVRRPQDPNKPKVARAPSEKVERKYSVYNDYCPPLSILDDDDISFPNIDWKATTQDMSSHPDAHLLHPKELVVASKLVLTPSVYVYIKRRFFHHRLSYAKRGATFNINAAQLACKGPDEFNITGIDVNKTSRLHKAFQKVGWLDLHHMERFL